MNLHNMLPIPHNIIILYRDLDTWRIMPVTKLNIETHYEHTMHKTYSITVKGTIIYPDMHKSERKINIRSVTFLQMS